MYLIYKDENGVKVARKDGRLDTFTKYYLSEIQAKAALYLESLDFKVVENDHPVSKVHLH